MTLALLLTAAFAAGAIVGVVIANELRLARRARGRTLDFTVPTRGYATRAVDLLELDWDDPRGGDT